MARPKKENEEESGKSGKTIQEILDGINKKYGANSVFKFNEGSVEKVDVVSTGSPSLDKALGIGGLPRGRLVELYGEPSTGKSTAALSTIAQAQAKGLKCFYIDAECAMDKQLCKNMGVDVDELLFAQPGCAEEALEITRELVASGAFAVGVVDSVAALVPKAELEGDIGDQTIGLQARLIGQALRMITGELAKSNTCLILINQLRSKIGGFGYGPQTDTPGGKSIKFYASIRLEVKRVGSVKQGEEIIGNDLEIKVTKNKLAPPFRTASTELIFGKGFNVGGELLDLGLKVGIIKLEGRTFTFGDQKLGTSRPAACQYLKDNSELMAQILKEVENAGN